MKNKQLYSSFEDLCEDYCNFLENNRKSEAECMHIMEICGALFWFVYVFMSVIHDDVDYITFYGIFNFIGFIIMIVTE